MKTKFIIIFLLITSSIKAQISLENTYVTRSHVALGFQEFFLTNLGNNNYKYVIYTYGYSGFGSFSLYNLDHTPFMLNIEVPVVSDSMNYSYFLGYITTTLFDCDSSNIEFAVMLNTPVPTAHPNFSVYRTDGTVIFSKDSVGTIFCVGCGSGSIEMHPIMNTPAGAKLLLYNYRDSNGNYDPNGNQHTYVYALCDTLPETINEIIPSNSYVKVFPNPTAQQVNFEVIPPNHTETFELTIFNSAFQSVKSTAIINAQTQLSIDTESFASGIYYYSFQTKHKVFQTGKFAVVK